MKSVNTYYTNLKNLGLFLQEHTIIDSPSLLIQVFTAKNDKVFIAEVLKNIIRLLPQAIIIGSTTDGEIMNGLVSTNKTVLSFTQFKHTTLKTAMVQHKKDGFFSGESIAKALIQEDTKLIIAFADGVNTNGEAFLKGFASVNNDVMIAGGLAADNAEFIQTYVFTKEAIITHGAVGIALNSTHLNVYNEYSFNWTAIGKELTVTKVKDNRVYTIDDKTAVDTYIHYLGKKMAEGLPAIGIEFPLILTNHGVHVARAVLAKYDDGSLGFAGNLKLGDKVRFGYGDPMKILSESDKVLEKIQNKPSEVIFIYSCMARRHFMPSIIETETLPLQDIAPSAGFFTYGEFFTSKSKELLNQTMTIISLSENNYIPKRKKEVSIKEFGTRNNSINALIHLVNITSHEAMEQEALIQAQKTFEKLFESSPDGILLIEKDRFIQCNQKMLDIFGYTSKEIFLNAKPLQVFPRKQPDGTHSFIKIREMKQLALKNGNHQFEWVYKKKNGELFWTDIMLTSIQLDGRNIMYVVCRDISERKEMELELSRQKNILYYQAHHDALTGLANRTLFMKELQKRLKEAKQTKVNMAIMFIDLDRFKNINDSLGHDVGDKVIHILGERIKRGIRKDDLVARLGGDEFLVMMKEVKNHTDILFESERILKIVSEPIVIDQHTLHTAASIGISRYPLDDTNASNLVKYADTAMYKAKEEGGNNFQFYKREMTDMAYEHVMMENDLRDALKNESFEVYYQPKINIESEKIVGLEALVRWNHPVVGLLAPDIFIPLAEKTGLIVELDLLVMQTAMREVSIWYDSELSPGMLALNISMKQLEYPDLLKKITTNLQMYGFKPEWLELEITENEMMQKPDKVIPILETLHSLGISIAIDDFGTGYSSLSYLKRLPIDTLKIDRSFIMDTPKDEDAVAIVETMITLAQSLHLTVVAEGVETKEQKDFLLSKRCHIVQGYYYSKPLCAADMRKMLVLQKKQI